jgi:hypothetical protein
MDSLSLQGETEANCIKYTNTVHLRQESVFCITKITNETDIVWYCYMTVDFATATS